MPENTVRPLWFRLSPWLLGALSFLLVVSTASHYGLSWDEPAYFHASDLKVQWLQRLGEDLAAGRLGESLSDRAISEAWHWSPYYVPHPPFSRILSGISKALLSGLIDRFLAYRLPTALLFALLVVVMYLWMQEAFGFAAALFTACLLVVTPHLFAQAHFAMTDTTLAALWVVAAYCFWRGLWSWRWSVALGVIWGIAIATKFPGLLIPIPLLLWAHIYQRRSYANNMFSMMFLSFPIAVLIHPYWWHQTLLRFVTFLYESVSRTYRPETNFSIYYFDHLLTSAELPWYYPFFMLGITIPEPVLVLSLVGAASTLYGWRGQQLMALFLANAVFVPGMGLAPGAALHDINRLMLPSLPFLAGLAGYGFFLVSEHVAKKAQTIRLASGIENLRPKLFAALGFLFLIPAAIDLIAYHPYQLSYYNRLVGGVRGAHRRGLEVTYMMEAFTPEFLRSLNEKLPSGAAVNASFANFMFRFYQRNNLFRPDIKITDGAEFDYYILLNRRSTFSQQDQAILAVKSAIVDTWGLNGVPLIFVFKARP